MKNQPNKTIASSQAQDAYKAPNLQEYGSIRELTTGGSGQANEGSHDTDLTRRS